MKWTLAAIATAAILIVAASHPAKAYNLQWCAVDSAGPGDCRYNSYQQCQAAVSGTGSYCLENPEFAFRRFRNGRYDQ
jgi:hypothetical protein